MIGQPIVLFGATGFLGSHVRSVLAEVAGANTWMSVARRGPAAGSTSENEQWLAFDAGMADVGDITAFLIAQRPAVVINCAGSTAGGVVSQALNNVVLPAKLIEAVELLPFSVRFVHLGSAAEYGLTGRPVPVDEAFPCRPLSAYGATKLAATHLVLAARRQSSLDAVVLRLFNPIGQGMPDQTLLGRAARAFRDALETGATEIRLGPLDAWRDYIDAREVARAVIAAAVLPAVIRAPVMNIGAGRAIQNRDVVRQLSRIAGFSGVILEDSDPSERSAVVQWQAANVELAAEILQWRPDPSLDAALMALWRGLPPRQPPPNPR